MNAAQVLLEGSGCFSAQGINGPHSVVEVGREGPESVLGVAELPLVYGADKILPIMIGGRYLSHTRELELVLTGTGIHSSFANLDPVKSSNAVTRR